MPRQKESISASASFKTFWDAYAFKRDRIGAEKVWKRLSAKDRKLALAGIAAYREDCRKRGISMMYAQGYLTHRRWEDDFEDDTVSQGDIFADALSDMDTW